MKSSLIQIKVGDPVIEKDRGIKCEVLDLKITPNGVDDPKLVVLLYVRKPDGGVLEGTSDRFIPCEDFEYEEFYPTPHLFNFEK